MFRPALAALAVRSDQDSEDFLGKNICSLFLTTALNQFFNPPISFKISDDIYITFT